MACKNSLISGLAAFGVTTATIMPGMSILTGLSTTTMSLTPMVCARSSEL